MSINTPQNTPQYDAKTGFLTDYGKSLGMKAVQPGDPYGKVTPAPVIKPPITNTGGIKTTDAPKSNNPYLEQVQALMKLSPEEVDAQKQLNTLQSNATQGQFNVSQQPVAQSFISGQQAAMQTQANIAQQPLQQKLALAQSQRQASLDSAKAALEYQKPTSLGIGTNLVNPLTGATVAQGQSYQEKLGATKVLQLNNTYPDAGILPSDDPDTAAQKASLAPSFIAKFGKQSAQWNAATGTFDIIETSRLGTTTPGGSYTGNPNITSTPTSTNGTTTSGGSSGGATGTNQVRQVQQALGISADGINGPQTKAAVKAFQTAHGLTADGIIGPKTLAAMGLSGGGGGTTTPTPSPSKLVPKTGISTLNQNNKIDSATLAYIQTGEMPSGVYPAEQGKVRARAQEVVPGFNPTVAKANAGAITDQTKQVANITSALSSAEATFDLLVTAAKKANINKSTVGARNAIQRALSQKLLSDADVAQFNSTVETLKTEYALVLGRGGEVTDAVRKQASDVIDKDLTTASLEAVQKRLQQEGKIAIKARQDEINRLSSGGTGNSNSSGGGSYKPGDDPSGIR